MKLSPPTRRTVALALALAGVASAGVASPRTAAAGEYTVRYCDAPNSAGLTDWKLEGVALGKSKEGCREGDPITFDGSAYLNGSVSPGRTQWTVDAPPGLAIADMAASASFSSQIGDQSGYNLYFASGGRGGGCGLDPGLPVRCGAASVVTLPAGTSARADSQRALVAVSCEPRLVNPSWTACSGSFFVRMISLELTWRDSVAPTGRADGALLRSAAGAPVSGALPVQVTANDEGSGIRYLEARAGGQVIGRTSERCAPPYVRAQPCPRGIVEEFSADTTRLRSGTHDLEIVAVDASGTEGVLSRSALVVDNGDGVIGPGTDLNLRGAPNGTYAGDDGRVTVWWASTERSPSRKKAVRRHCKASKSYRRRHTVACNGRPGKQSVTAGYSATRRARLAGRLTRPDGAPIAGAQVRVTTTIAGRTVLAAVPTTDARGEFVVKMPVRDGSATIGVGWHARQRDTVPSATGQAQLRVKAATSFAVARKAKPGGRLVFRGRLRGSGGAQTGVPVLIQANAGNGWRAAMTVQAAGSGRWRATYRVPTQLRGTYRFRAKVLRSSRYPYEPSATGSRTVRIR